ncbi:hypothetical protein [Azospirillum sp. Marseille-Q6669]
MTVRNGTVMPFFISGFSGAGDGVRVRSKRLGNALQEVAGSGGMAQGRRAS